MEKIYSLPHTPSPSWEISFISTFLHGIFMNGSYRGFTGYFQCFICLLFNSPPFSCEHPSLIPIQALPPCILLIGLYWFCPLCLSVVSQNHSASLCLSIGEGGLYSHPRYRRSFIATWQKTRNLFKSLQNRLFRNIKNLYLYLIT